MAAAHEPGSPFLMVADTVKPERFNDAEALAQRLHQLRGSTGLDVAVGHCSNGETEIPCVLIWKSAPRAYLAFSAGRDVDTPSRLLAALSRTRAAVAA